MAKEALVIPPREAISEFALEESIALEETLAVITAPGAPLSPGVRALIERASPAMRREHHYAVLHFGFLKAGQAPYGVLEWKKDAGNDALERRWVAQQFGQLLSSMFPTKKWACFLAAGCGTAEQALAEDLFTRQMQARYEHHKLDAFRLLVDAVSQEEWAGADADPHYAIRFARQLNFRRWVNENPDEATSLALAERLGDFCRQRSLFFECLDREQLEELNMGLLLAVGRAAERSPPRLLLAGHRLDAAGKDKPLLLIGKGVTFDTGGINLKPHESFVNCMKNDMAGAALMIQLFMALVESGYERPLALAVPACENLIGAHALKPGSIVRSHAGKDVIIEHTDAEGRLILADALSYAQKRWAPRQTLIAATLTTAALRQFSQFYTPVHFAPAALVSALEQASASWGESFSFWKDFLPFREGNMTSAADLTNLGRLASHASMGGGSNVAAHFLREFATAPMAHFDIFATTWNWGGDYPGAHYGATGAPFNSLFTALRMGTV